MRGTDVFTISDIALGSKLGSVRSFDLNCVAEFSWLTSHCVILCQNKKDNPSSMGLKL